MTAPVPTVIATRIKAYVSARSVREEAADRVKQLQAIEDRAEAELFDELERAGLRAVKDETQGTFSLNDIAWAKVDDEATARAWAEANHPELLLLNRQRLAVVVRDALKGDVEMPPGVSFTSSRKITWRRPKGGDE